jgi:predicted HNH restriction endonuclease
MRHDRRKRPLPKKDSGKSVEEIVRELRQVRGPVEDYREQSLKIHGLVCAKCGREFEEKDRHLLTVHHKDGNHQNNPPDGSNWENLCIYCHDDEHSRGMLGDYLRHKED